MTEWILSLFLSVPMITGSALLIEKAYRVLDCERRAFNRARFQIELPQFSRSGSTGTQIYERCGKDEVRVFLPALDPPSS